MKNRSRFYRYILTIDHGNTNPHAGLYQFTDEHDWTFLEIFPLSSLDTKMAEYTLNAENTFALASVVGQQKKLSNYLRKLSIPLFDLQGLRTIQKFNEMPVFYSESLGQDRLIQCYDLYLEKKKNRKKFKALLIDSGTFTTIDTVSEKGFLGGSIFPGTCSLLQTYSLGARLPLLGIDDLKDSLSSKEFDQIFDLKALPHDTKTAILSSILSVQKLICSHALETPGLTNVILTGGKASLFNRLIRGLFEAQDFSPMPEIETKDNYIHHALFRLACSLISSGPTVGPFPSADL